MNDILLFYSYVRIFVYYELFFPKCLSLFFMHVVKNDTPPSPLPLPLPPSLRHSQDSDGVQSDSIRYFVLH